MGRPQLAWFENHRFLAKQIEEKKESRAFTQEGARIQGSKDVQHRSDVRKETWRRLSRS